MKDEIRPLGVDLDSRSTFRLLHSYFLAERMFPDADKEVGISSSGGGFHMVIDVGLHLIDNLVARSLLKDDPRRISLALEKLGMNSEEKHFDLIFDSKTQGGEGGGDKKLDIDRILEPYEEEVEEIHDMWGEQGFVKKIGELSKKIKQEVREKMSDIHITLLEFDTAELKEKLNKVCKDTKETAEEKGEKFNFRIYENYGPRSDYRLCVFSESEEKANDRGKWFRGAVFNDSEEGPVTEKDLEKVVEFDNGKIFRVKEKEGK